MRTSYSLYEAKAKLSAIVRQVREGQHVTVTVHGEPVVEIRPVAPKKKGLAARLEELENRGILVGASSSDVSRTSSVICMRGMVRKAFPLSCVFKYPLPRHL